MYQLDYSDESSYDKWTGSPAQGFYRSISPLHKFWHSTVIPGIDITCVRQKQHLHYRNFRG